MIVPLKFKVCNPVDPKRCKTFEGIADTGSYYTWIPNEAAEELGLTERERVALKTIASDRIERGLAIAGCEVEGRSGGCDVVLGEDGEGIVIGADTFEHLGLKVDPKNGRITRSG